MTAPDEQRRDRATGHNLRNALLASAGWLEAGAERVNSLNVFPVPDGDTGTNMSLTFRAARDALQAMPEEASVSEVASASYRAMMVGARGNSGVILSQLFRGFAHALDGELEITPLLFARGLCAASEAAYASVSAPVEGTILTVARVAGAAAEEGAQAGDDLPSQLERTLAAATAAVAATPSQMEALRRAGVVDSGGEGLRLILEGAWMWSAGRSLEEARAQLAAPSPSALDAIAHTDADAYGFCTEFLLTDCPVPLTDVREQMEMMGRSVIAVGDEKLLRVHVHTERPGQVLEYAVDRGTLSHVKVENMELQHASLVAARGAARNEEEPPGSAEDARVAVVAVSPGPGFTEVFRSLGATTVRGGQSMNPSVQELLAAINRVPQDQVVLLPNNGNVILAANQATSLTQKRVEVIPTRTAPEGIGAALAFNYQQDVEENAEAMSAAAQKVHTIEVARAARTSEVDGIEIRVDEFLGRLDGRVIVAAASEEQAALAALTKACLPSVEILTIYYGEGASEETGQALATKARAAYPDAGVEVVEGGQPHYPYVISLE